MADRPRPSSTERGEASNMGRETQQRNETSQERIERVRRENTRNYICENRRANETPEQQDRKLDVKREKLSEKLKSARNNFEEQAIAFKFQGEYINREKIARGLENVEYLNYNQHQIEEYAKICIEAESFVEIEEPVMGLEHLTHQIAEDISFRRIPEDYTIYSVNRASNDWEKFRVEKFDDIVSEYKLANNETRLLMLADIMQYERSNRSTIEQLNSKEYKTIVKLTMYEWDKWKRDSSQS